MSSGNAEYMDDGDRNSDDDDLSSNMVGDSEDEDEDDITSKDSDKSDGNQDGNASDESDNEDENGAATNSGEDDDNNDNEDSDVESPNEDTNDDNPDWNTIMDEVLAERVDSVQVHFKNTKKTKVFHPRHDIRERRELQKIVESPGENVKKWKIWYHNQSKNLQASEKDTKKWCRKEIV